MRECRYLEVQFLEDDKGLYVSIREQSTSRIVCDMRPDKAATRLLISLDLKTKDFAMLGIEFKSSGGGTGMIIGTAPRRSRLGEDS